MGENRIPRRVELIDDRSCPHVGSARQAVLAGLARVGLEPS